MLNNPQVDLLPIGQKHCDLTQIRQLIAQAQKLIHFIDNISLFIHVALGLICGLFARISSHIFGHAQHFESNNVCLSSMNPNSRVPNFCARSNG